MFTNLLVHLLTIIAMAAVIAIAIMIIAFIACFAYVVVKHIIKSAYQSTHQPKLTAADKEKLEKTKKAIEQWADKMKQYTTTEDNKDE